MRFHNIFVRKISVVLFSILLLILFSSGQQLAIAKGTITPLVGTQWLEENLNIGNIRIVHVGSMNPQSQQMFGQKHIPGSVYVGIGELMEAMGNGSAPPDRQKSEALMSRLGIDSKTQVIIVGGSDNPFTTAAAWLIKYNGHEDVSYLNGGVGKWIRENRPMTGNAVTIKPASYSSTPDDSILANADHVLKNLQNANVKILDVRSPGEYTGKDNPTNNKRTGHIPGGINMEFYSTNLRPDGTFKSVSDLSAVYAEKGITKDKEIIVYCEGGVRAAHTHFVLKYLLGYPNVRNYVGSWGEWSSRLDPAKYPIEK